MVNGRQGIEQRAVQIPDTGAKAHLYLQEVYKANGFQIGLCNAELLAGQVLDSGYEVHGINAVLLHQVHFGCTVRIARQADLDQTLAQSVLRDNISNSGAETADIQMVFDGNNAVLALLDGLNDGRVGERLEGGKRAYAVRKRPFPSEPR